MRLMIACSALALSLGCASIEVVKITDENRATAEGIRYWRPAPYLTVFGEKDGTCSVKIIYLPDPSEEYAIRATAGFGAASLKPTLANGWNLTAFDSSVDSKAADVLGAFSKAVSPAGARTEEKPAQYTTIRPGLYRIKMDGKSGSLALDPTGVFKDGPVCSALKGAPEGGDRDGGGKGGE